MNLPRKRPHLDYYFRWFMNERPRDWARIIWDVDPSPIWLEGEL